jgi:BASS family bile acid:Na+ symporter
VSLAQIVPLAINASLFLIVLALGLRAQLDEATYLFRHPGLLLRAITAMNLVMPAFVIAATLLVPLAPAIKIALVALAVSPVPPILPGKQEKADGKASHAIGLLVAAALLSLILVPAAMEVVGRAFDRDVHMPFDRVLPIVLLSVLTPLALGILLRSALPRLGEWLTRKMAVLGTALLLIALVPLLIGLWPAISSLLGRGVLVVLVLFTLVGLAVGHLLGGPDRDDRSVLALATGTRHPGVAMALASLNFPNERAASAVVILHLLVGAIASAPYVKWRARSHAGEGT